METLVQEEGYLEAAEHLEEILEEILEATAADNQATTAAPQAEADPQEAVEPQAEVEPQAAAEPQEVVEPQAAAEPLEEEVAHQEVEAHQFHSHLPQVQCPTVS